MAEIPFNVEYKNVKNLRLTVYPPDGRVLISAPFGTSRDQIGKFAASKIEWIEKHRQRYMNHSKMNGGFHNHAMVYVWGETYELLLIERKGHPKIEIEGQFFKMYLRPGTTKIKKQEFLDKWYRNTLKETAPEYIRKWETRLGIEISNLYVRKMKSHWGSCNCEKKTLRLNSELVKRKKECLEYVIVHEMLHIFEKNHNRNFYRLLEKHIPEWKVIRKKMNSGDI
ncbi:MAG: M48 family metallopeptidase [Treponema sp.]|nr:M48 family metallopeptidase [Treponema sp.]